MKIHEVPENHSTTIAVDYDNTLAATLPPVHQQLRLKHPNLGEYEDINHWNYHKDNANEADFYNAYNQVHANADYAPLHEAIEYYAILQVCGFNTYILTATPQHKHHQLRKWLTKHGLSDEPIIHNPNKGEEQYDILIDDCVANIQAAEDTGRQAILIQQPWNKHYGHQYTAKNWREAFQHCLTIIAAETI